MIDLVAEEGETKKIKNHLLHLLKPKGILARVSYVEKPILILVLLIDRTHQSCSWWENLIDEDEDCLFWRKLDTFADDVYKLAYSEVCWYEVFLLVDSRDVRLFNLLTDDWNPICIFLTNTLSFSLALLEGVLVLKFRSHFCRKVGVIWIFKVRIQWGRRKRRLGRRCEAMRRSLFEGYLVA